MVEDSDTSLSKLTLAVFLGNVLAQLLAWLSFIVWMRRRLPEIQDKIVAEVVPGPGDLFGGMIGGPREPADHSGPPSGNGPSLGDLFSGSGTEIEFGSEDDEDDEDPGAKAS